MLMLDRCVFRIVECGGAPVLVAERAVLDGEDLLLLAQLVAGVEGEAALHLGLLAPVLLLLPLRSTVLEPDLHLLLGHLQEPAEDELQEERKEEAREKKTLKVDTADEESMKRGVLSKGEGQRKGRCHLLGEWQA